MKVWIGETAWYRKQHTMRILQLPPRAFIGNLNLFLWKIIYSRRNNKNASGVFVSCSWRTNMENVIVNVFLLMNHIFLFFFRKAFEVVFEAINNSFRQFQAGFPLLWLTTSLSRNSRIAILNISLKSWPTKIDHF